MVTFDIEGIIWGMDVIIHETAEDRENIGDIVKMYVNSGMLPKPRYQAKSSEAFEPFDGTVESVEETKTQTGKQMFIANVRPDTKEGEDKKPLVAVKFMPPRNTWRVNDLVHISKNDKGWMELHEREQTAPF